MRAAAQRICADKFSNSPNKPENTCLKHSTVLRSCGVSGNLLKGPPGSAVPCIAAFLQDLQGR